MEFILYGVRGLHAFEVKGSSRFRETDLDALRLFADEYPEAKGHLLYGGTRRSCYGPVEVLPLADALAELPTILE